ncbi:MAG: hypothetical protein JOS17DRAFT_734032 [Linnemannia elongata]|nr:MAG: hypothetical protein JOS17DRAFT_734032 [Linnemannia elongata]
MSLLSLPIVLLSPFAICSHPPSIIPLSCSFLLLQQSRLLLLVLLTSSLTHSLSLFQEQLQGSNEEDCPLVIAIVSWKDVINNKGEIGRKATTAPFISFLIIILVDGWGTNRTGWGHVIRGRGKIKALKCNLCGKKGVGVVSVSVFLNGGVFSHTFDWISSCDSSM